MNLSLDGFTIVSSFLMAVVFLHVIVICPSVSAHFLSLHTFLFYLNRLDCCGVITVINQARTSFFFKAIRSIRIMLMSCILILNRPTSRHMLLLTGLDAISSL